MNELLLGAIAMAAMVAGLVFFRYWRSSRDRFFLYFALAFWIDGVNRAHFGLTGAVSEEDAYYYLVRLLSFGLILWAILEKNVFRQDSK
jgi:hypothetical protein